MRLALRHLLRRPATSIVAVLALAAGIGASTALFALVDRVLVRPLPYAGADRLAQVWTTFPHWRGEAVLDAQWDRIGLAWEDLEAVRSNARTISAAGAAYFRELQTASAGGVPEVRVVARGTASLTDVLGVQPALGRWFRQDEEGPDAPAVAVASWEYWSTRLGGDPAAVGRDVRIEGQPFTLIGVLPRGFRFAPVMPPTESLGEPALWVPPGTSANDFTRNSHNWETVVRLRDGVSQAVAEAELVPLLRGDRPPERRGARLVSRLEAVAGRARAPLLMLFAATGTLLLIACGNVALLLLGDARSRAGEFATKVALGASRARLVRELLAGSVLLAAAGGLVGIGLAYATVRALPALLPAELPRAAEIAIDPRVLAFAVLVSLITGIAAGLGPAVLSARGATLQSGARMTARGAMRTASGVMAGQVALSTVLLVAATLFGRSLALQTEVDPGVDAGGILAVSVELPRWKHDAASATALFEQALARLGALPGVRAAALTTRLPLSGEGGSWAVAIEPDTVLSSESGVAYHEAVSPSLFGALGLRILEGRPLTEADGPDAPRVAVINRTMAERMWPGGASPVGRAFRAPNGGRRIVIGVVSDVRHHGLERLPEPAFYESIAQLPSGRAVLLLRTDGSPHALAGQALDVVRRLDADIPAPHVRALDDVLRASTADERFRAALAATFGWIATLLAGIGLAGVTLRAVTTRRRELAVRMALGATPTHAVGVVARSALLAVGAGLVVGVPAALAVARVFASRLYAVGPADPASIAIATLALASVAALALVAPAARAARTRPAEVLRAE